MAFNEVFKVGNNISLPVPAGTASGDPVRVGGLNGVAQTNVAVAGDLAGLNRDGYASIKLDGAHQLQVTGEVAPGDPVYIDADFALSTTAAGGSLFGHALTTKAVEAVGPVTVRIDTTGPASA